MMSAVEVASAMFSSMFWHSAIWSFRALAVEGAAAAGGGVVVPDAGGLAVGACAPPPEIAPDPLFVSSPPPDEQAATAKDIPSNPIIVSFFMATVPLSRLDDRVGGMCPNAGLMPTRKHIILSCDDRCHVSRLTSEGRSG
jgi:hypothetical protein